MENLFWIVCVSMLVGFDTDVLMGHLLAYWRKSMGKTFGHLPVGKANAVTYFFVTLQEPSGLEITDDCHLCYQKHDYN